MQNISLINKKVSNYLISNEKKLVRHYCKHSSHFLLYANSNIDVNNNI